MTVALPEHLAVAGVDDAHGLVLGRRRQQRAGPARRKRKALRGQQKVVCLRGQTVAQSGKFTVTASGIILSNPACIVGLGAICLSSSVQAKPLQLYLVRGGEHTAFLLCQKEVIFQRERDGLILMARAVVLSL